MSFHNEIQRRKKYNYNKELEEVADEIKTERFLDKEEVDAPIVVTKEQLEAKRREDRGLPLTDKPPAGKAESVISAVSLTGLLLSLAVCGLLQKIFGFFYAAAFVLLMFAVISSEKDRKNGGWKKVSLLQRAVFLLMSLASFAIAIYLTVKWK